MVDVNFSLKQNMRDSERILCKPILFASFALSIKSVPKEQVTLLCTENLLSIHLLERLEINLE